MARFRRLSEKQQMVTLGEINVTPLIDLAFVLLIIFVITTQTIEYSLELKLPEGGDPPSDTADRNQFFVDIPASGDYEHEGEVFEDYADLWALIQEEKRKESAEDGTSLEVVVRADEAAAWGLLARIWEDCQREKIGIRMGFARPEDE